MISELPFALRNLDSETLNAIMQDEVFVASIFLSDGTVDEARLNERVLALRGPPPPAPPQIVGLKRPVQSWQPQGTTEGTSRQAIPCKYFGRGAGCARGDRCAYLHGAVIQQDPNKRPRQCW